MATSWPEPTLAILGILTLLAAIYSWWERQQVVNLRVARRARRVYRVLHEWLNDGSYDVTNAARLGIWQQKVSRGEDEVQELLEEMLDLAGEAAPRVQRATRHAYAAFLRGADLINKYGQPELTGHATAGLQAEGAYRCFKSVLQEVAVIVPTDLR